MIKVIKVFVIDSKRSGNTFLPVLENVFKGRRVTYLFNVNSKAPFLKKAPQFKMENIINLGIPHVGEHIFESINTPGLLNCLEVSQTWKELAENVLIKRWKGKMLEACISGETKVVQLLLERCNSGEIGLNSKDNIGMTVFMWACRTGHICCPIAP